jgi:signal transduction histidine kinase/ligand-binding sensor domain-containing protein
VNTARLRILAAILFGSARLLLAAEPARTNLTFNIQIWGADEGLPSSVVAAIAQTRDGYLWLGTYNGLVRFDGLRFKVFDPGNTPALTESRVTSLIADDDGALWIGTESQNKVVLRNGQFTAVTNLPASPDPRTLVSRFWTANRLDRIFTTAPPWSFTAVRASCLNHDGSLIVGTVGGVFVIQTNGSWHSITTRDGISENKVQALLVDREGTLWVGTDPGGLNRIRPQAIGVVPETRGLTIKSVAADATEGVWFTTGGAGFALCREHRAANSFSTGPWWSVFCAGNDLWLGNSFGGWRWDIETQPQLPQPMLRVPPGVNALHRDRAGKLWFGSSSGLAGFDGTNWTLLTTNNGLSSDVITAIVDGADGALWIGTRDGGVNRLLNGKVTVFRASDGAPSDDIAGLWLDAHGILWVTSFNSGLGRFENGRWTRYTTRDGLVSNSLSYIIEDEEENLWIGSNAGVIRVSKRTLNDFAAGKVHTVTCRAFSKSDGFPTVECSSGSQPGALRDRDGQLWFPTMQGLAYVDPKQLTRNTNPPLVAIQSVLVDESVRLADGAPGITVALSPRDERIEIQFARLNLSAPERGLTRYQMEGYETAWRADINNSRFATYTKLPPGKYTFRVVACNEDGVWNENGRTLGIIVQPPIWRTWWFLTISTLVLVGIIAGTSHYFSNQRYERAMAVLRQQEALEKERARIARDIHDQVGASLTQVALLGELVEADKESPKEIEEHAAQICQTARETTRALDEIVWTVNPQNDTLEGLVNYICKYAQDFLSVAGVKYRLEVPPDLPPIPIAPDVRHNVFLASKEAITNVVRHAKAESAWVRLHLRDDRFLVEIEDNGRGLADMDHARAKTRHGLSNMRKRMEDIGGEFALEPAPERGAIVRLTVPLKKSTPRASA